ERDDRGRRAAALCVGDDGGLAALEDRHDGVGGPEVDADGLGHGATSSSVGTPARGRRNRWSRTLRRRPRSGPCPVGGLSWSSLGRSGTKLEWHVIRFLHRRKPLPVWHRARRAAGAVHAIPAHVGYSPPLRRALHEGEDT